MKVLSAMTDFKIVNGPILNLWARETVARTKQLIYFWDANFVLDRDIGSHLRQRAVERSTTKSEASLHNIKMRYIALTLDTDSFRIRESQ